MKKIIRYFKILFKKHIPTFGYCANEEEKEVFAEVFDTCTFIAIK